MPLSVPKHSLPPILGVTDTKKIVSINRLDYVVGFPAVLIKFKAEPFKSNSLLSLASEALQKECRSLVNPRLPVVCSKFPLFRSNQSQNPSFDFLKSFYQNYLDYCDSCGLLRSATLSADEPWLSKNKSVYLLTHNAFYYYNKRRDQLTTITTEITKLDQLKIMFPISVPTLNFNEVNFIYDYTGHKANNLLDTQYEGTFCYCSLRAHFMSIILELYGIDTLKVYQFWSERSWKNNSSNNPHWMFHCALLIEDDTKNKWVFDPWVDSATHFLTLNEWTTLKNRPPPKKLMIANKMVIDPALGLAGAINLMRFGLKEVVDKIQFLLSTLPNRPKSSPLLTYKTPASLGFFKRKSILKQESRDKDVKEKVISQHIHS